jgi:phosphoribosylformimino-5-aminoimidazole carboxamide ribotide isomerase
VRVIGVLDLLGGCAVHARAGVREAYRPVLAVAHAPIGAGDARALAQAYVNDLGVSELYVADLDVILERRRLQNIGRAASKGRPMSHAGIIRELAALGTPLWLDAAVSSVADACHALRLGAAHVIVGLETLPSFDALEQISAAVGRDRVAFSLDLRNGEPVMADGAPDARGAVLPREAAHVVAARAVDAGAGAVIVIDLARVGTNTGLDLELVARVRDAAPAVTLLAGGGVRGMEDLARLADAGCDGALVATALHDGRLGAAHVVAARRLGVIRPPASSISPAPRGLLIGLETENG